MYCVPKIKRFDTITQQSQISWRSNLSSESKRHVFLQDMAQNLLLIRDDLSNYFKDNKDYLYPTENEEYIHFDTSSSMIPPEELLYRLIDIIKNNDFIFRLEEAASTITSLSKEIDNLKSEIRNLIKKGNNENSISSYMSDYQGVNPKDLIEKLNEKNKLNKKIIKDYDNLVDEYITGLSQRSAYEEKIKNLQKNLRDYEKIKMKNEELNFDIKQLKDEINLNNNEINELKKLNNRLYDENIKIKDELQRTNKIFEFRNKEYNDLDLKNKNLLKLNYVSNMALQRNEEKMKLLLDNINDTKEKNKNIIDGLENKINEKNEQIKKLQNELKNSISNLINDNKNGNLEFIFDEINNKLKLIYKGEIICYVPRFKRELQSFFSNQKYNINSNIHPSSSLIKKDKNKNYKPMTMTEIKNKKKCDIDNFNITYKLSQNEYEFDHSESSNKKLSFSSKKSKSYIRLDQLCETISNSFTSGSQSNIDLKSKSIKKNKTQNYIDNFFKDINNRSKKKIQRSMTEFKGGKFMKKSISKFKSFGIDVESIKEEKNEDSISICSFDCKINSKKRSHSKIDKKSKEFSMLSSFLETESCVPVKKVNNNNFIINHVEDFLIRRNYFYPNNVKLNIKKINVKRIIHSKESKNQIQTDDNKMSDCQIF